MDYEAENENSRYSDEPDSEEEQSLYHNYYHNLSTKSESIETTTISNDISNTSPLIIKEDCLMKNTDGSSKKRKRDEPQLIILPSSLLSDSDDSPKKPKRNKTEVITLSSSDSGSSSKKFRKNKNEIVVLSTSSEEDDDDHLFNKVPSKKQKVIISSKIKLNTCSNSIRRNTNNIMNSIIKNEKKKTLSKSSTDVVKTALNFSSDSDEDLEDIWDKMSDKKSLWKVNAIDYIKTQYRKTCDNCKEKGHIKRFCTKPLKIAKCTLCGISGHEFDDCPTPLCVACQVPGHWEYNCLWRRLAKDIICDLCKMVGHLRPECPDNWRRFYLTTKEGPLVKPKSDIRPDNVSCFNCGSDQHFGHECKSKRPTDFQHPTSPFVFSFDDPYSEKLTKNGKQVKEFKNKLHQIGRSDKRNIEQTCCPSKKKFSSDFSITNREPNFPRNNSKDHGRPHKSFTAKKFKKPKKKSFLNNTF